jgi:SAM-dependent methyltransferase
MTDPVQLERRWTDRVRASREQVDRVRELPDGPDFYRPVTSLFVADPHRRDDPVLDAVLAHARPGDVWLDVGAGAGRYALPLALRVREVIALDPSPGMLDALAVGAAQHGIPNVRAIRGRWPEAAGELGPAPTAEAALIAHVGYDVEAIGPFVRALEDAAGRLCVAILMDRSPATIAFPFWPLVHGEERVPLPSLPDFVELLEARGARPEVAYASHEIRRFDSRDQLAGFIRRQLWVAEGGARDRRMQEALDDWLVSDGDGVRLRDQPTLSIGVVTWPPRPRAAPGGDRSGPD